jgi:hypothetical protein
MHNTALPERIVYIECQMHFFLFYLADLDYDFVSQRLETLIL